MLRAKGVHLIISTTLWTYSDSYYTQRKRFSLLTYRPIAGGPTFCNPCTSFDLLFKNRPLHTRQKVNSSSLEDERIIWGFLTLFFIVFCFGDVVLAEKSVLLVPNVTEEHVSPAYLTSDTVFCYKCLIYWGVGQNCWLSFLSSFVSCVLSNWGLRQ